MSNVVKTATSSTTCTCCGAGTLGTLSSRQRGGPATLCGNSENTGFASTPPKKYRKKRVSGAMAVCNSSPPCTAVPSTFIQQRNTYNYNCGNDFSPSTCVQTNFNSNATQSCTNGPPATIVCPTVGCVSPVGIQQNQTDWKLPIPSGSCISVSGINGPVVFGPPTSVSSIQNIVTRVNLCCNGSPFFTVNGTIIETLSDEDTDADASARAAALLPWSSFTTAPDSGVAEMQPRTTGFTFTFVDVEFKVDGTGFAPATSHTVTVEVFRAVVGTGAYALFQTLIYSVTSDGSGNISFTDSVPNASGFDTYVTNPRIF